MKRKNQSTSSTLTHRSVLQSLTESISLNENYEINDLFSETESDNMSDCFETSSCYSDDFNENEENRPKNNDDQPIYDGSKLKLKEFALSFLWIMNKFKMPRNHRSFLYKYIKNLIPNNNILPNSYHILLKKNFSDTLKSKIIKTCCFCNHTLISKTCKIDNCSKPIEYPLGTRLYYESIIFDANSQLKIILERNWEAIKLYRSILFKGLFYRLN